MNIYKNIKKLITESIKSKKWSRYNATDSEVIVKAERNEHPHCEDHYPELQEIELNKLNSKINHLEVKKELGMTTLEAVLTQLHSSGKHLESTAFDGSIGTHGLGLKCVTALSSYLSVKTFRKGSWYSIQFADGPFALGTRLNLENENHARPRPDFLDGLMAKLRATLPRNFHAGFAARACHECGRETKQAKGLSQSVVLLHHNAA